MLLPDNINPENTIYYNAYFVLKEIRKKTGVSVVDLYAHVREERKMTFSLFLLCLDWLFLIDTVNIDGGGNIVCL